MIDDRFVLEVFENISIHYKKEGAYLLNARGRLADKIVKKHYGDTAGYVALSYVEMEYAANEAEYILKTVNRVF